MLHYSRVIRNTKAEGREKSTGNREIERERETEAERERETEGRRDRERQRETGRQRERETTKQRGRERATDPKYFTNHKVGI